MEATVARASTPEGTAANAACMWCMHVVDVVNVVDVVWRVLFRSGACWTVLLRVAPLLSASLGCPLECNRHAMLP